MKRLKTTEVKPFRVSRLEEQDGLCMLCQQPISSDEAVLDHDHKTGVCRGVLHRGCNVMLGKVENAQARSKLTDKEHLSLLLVNLISYLDSNLNVLHPTHRSAEEKRLKRNAKAKKKRKLIGDLKNELTKPAKKTSKKIETESKDRT